MNEKDLDEDDLLGALEEAEKGLIEIEDDDEQVPYLGIGERDQGICRTCIHHPCLCALLRAERKIKMMKEKKDLEEKIKELENVIETMRKKEVSLEDEKGRNLENVVGEGRLQSKK